MADLERVRQRVPRGSRRVDPAKPDDRPGSRSPWRVEGERSSEEPKRPQSPFGRRFWVVLLVLLVANYLISSLLMQPPTRTEVPYTLFRAQVSAGNVPRSTRSGTTIDGSSPRRSASPRARAAPTSTGLHHPAAGLRRQRRAVPAARPSKDVQVNAAPAGRPVAAEPGAASASARPCCSSRCSSSSCGAPRPARAAGIGGLGRSKAERYEPTTGSAPRSTTSPASTRPRRSSPRSSTSSRTRTGTRGSAAQIPQGRAAVRAARHRQDAAGPRGRRRGRRAVLLALRLGVRRDDRGRRREPGPRPVRPGEEDRAGDHLHRRARRHRPGPRRRASLGGHDEREQTLNQILTEMDGFTGTRGRDRAGRDQPAGDPRPGPAAARPLRPPRVVQPARPPPAGGRSSTCTPRGVPLAADVDLEALAADHPRHGRRRSGEPRQRGGADGRPAQPRARSTRRLHRRAGADRARRRAAASCSRRRSASARPTTSAATRCSGMLHAGRRPGAQDLDRPARARAGRDLPGARRRPLRLRRRLPARAGSSARSAAGRPRSSSTATSRPAPSPTSSRSPRIARRMVGRWGMSEAIGPVSVLPRPGRRAACSPAPRAGRPRRTRSSSTPRCAGSSTTATTRRLRCSPTEREQLDGSPRPCWSTRPSTRRTRTGSPGCRRCARTRRSSGCRRRACPAPACPLPGCPAAAPPRDPPGLPGGPAGRARRDPARPPRRRPLPVAGGPGLRGDGRVAAGPGRALPGSTWPPCPAGRRCGTGWRACSAWAASVRRRGGPTGSSGPGASRAGSTRCCSRAPATGPSGSCSTSPPWTPAAATTLDAWAPSKEGRRLADQLSTGGDEESLLRVSTSTPASCSTARWTGAATPLSRGCPAAGRTSTCAGWPRAGCPPARSSSTGGSTCTGRHPDRRRRRGLGRGAGPDQLLRLSVSFDGRWLVVSATPAPRRATTSGCST